MRVRVSYIVYVQSKYYTALLSTALPTDAAALQLRSTSFSQFSLPLLFEGSCFPTSLPFQASCRNFVGNSRHKELIIYRVINSPAAVCMLLPEGPLVADNRHARQRKEASRHICSGLWIALIGRLPRMKMTAMMRTRVAVVVVVGGSRRGGGFVGFVVDCGCWVDGWMLVNLWVSHLLSFLIGLVSK
jgi:hypothetical protein